MKIIYVFLLLLFSLSEVLSQNKSENRFASNQQKKVIIIIPTGEKVNDLPEMTTLSDTAALYNTVMTNIKNSFVNEFLDLFTIVQIYLKNNHKLDSIEPAYLALTENQGGWAKFGFALKEGDSHVIKSQTAYVDITVGQATARLNRLMSFTQLYPHEMGHVFFHLLSPEDTVTNNTKNVDMHFFSIVTDYSTAFNEGFAEHIENVSRAIEKNDSIKSGILADTEHIGKSSKPSINGFERDFKYPVRLGYYKAAMLNWYQKYEDYKRFQHVENGAIRYKNASIELSNKEDQLTFRNSGVKFDETKSRNLVQMHATEGVVSLFFTRLSTSRLSQNYMNASFYKDFISDTDTVLQSPEELFTPLQNQFIKYFSVLHNFVVLNNSSKSQLSDFIEGYIQTFPSEEDEVRAIYKEATGLEYTNEMPPPLWLLVKDYSHRLLTFDPFDAITVPIYTFDLNAAEVEDLETISGVTKIDAKKIIAYRETNGLFNNLSDLKNVPELPSEISDKIISAELDNTYFEEVLEDYDPKLSIGVLLVKPLQYVFSRALIYFLLLFGVGYFFFIRKERPAIKQIIGLFVRYFFLWVILVLSGLIIVFIFGQGYIIHLSFTILLALLTILIYRKRKEKMIRMLITIGIMSLAILISVI